MPPAPGYPKCVWDRLATGPRVLNPAVQFVSGRVYSAPRTSPARAFFHAPIDVRGPRTFASSLHVSDARVSARAVRADCSRTAKSGFPARLYTYIAAASHVSAKMAGRVAPSAECRAGNFLFPRHRATHLNPVSRSIAPQNNNPKNLPVHGLNVIASARIQTSSNGGFATRRKGRFAPLSRWPAGQP